MCQRVSRNNDLLVSVSFFPAPSSILLEPFVLVDHS
jgi:hypothetical protein